MRNPTAAKAHRTLFKAAYIPAWSTLGILVPFDSKIGSLKRIILVPRLLRRSH